ncbi:MAG: hypothetical protein LUH54_04180 [Firmicutes bacterium]|nr:hypothetical protein [Bacillota bacterium]
MIKLVKRLIIFLVLCAALGHLTGSGDILSGKIYSAVSSAYEYAKDSLSCFPDTENTENDDVLFAWAESDTDEVDEYCIREYGWRIGVFRRGQDTPLYVIDVYLFTLPKSAREALSVGIFCEGDEIEGYIEAFTS